jgi:hypothetical protein
MTYQIFVHRGVDLVDPIDQISLLTCHRAIELRVPDGRKDTKHTSRSPTVTLWERRSD